MIYTGMERGTKMFTGYDNYFILHSDFVSFPQAVSHKNCHAIVLCSGM